LELIVLDQSDDERTKIAVTAEVNGDPRVRYLRLGALGKPQALNQGRMLAQGDFLMLTDDDCEVEPDWIDRMLTEFASDPGVACVFGRVDAGPFDPTEAYVPVCVIEAPKTLRRLDELLTMPGWGNLGMGANMGLRADVVDYIGGWDPCIGPGAKFGSGDDHDMSVRLLRGGFRIRFSPLPRVVHFGLRRWSTAGKDQRRIWYGVGSVFAKHLRCGAFYPGGIRGPAYTLRDCASSLLHGKRPYGLSYVGSWCRGLASGLVHPINRHARQFIGQADEASYGNRFAEVVLRAAPSASKDPRGHEVT